mmetsp:Transcript_10371/g.21594  ORF Transcript_10371/g.21594 Transcript_10371/m.21594 type:complete len:200 (+) Transcript_10371:599-1198(+)
MLLIVSTDSICCLFQDSHSGFIICLRFQKGFIRFGAEVFGFVHVRINFSYFCSCGSLLRLQLRHFVLQSFDFCSLLLDEEGIVVALFGDGVVLRFAMIFLFRVRCSFTLQFFKHLLNLCQNCGEGTFWKSILNLRSYQCEPNTLGLLSLCLQDFKGALQFQGRTGRTGRTVQVPLYPLWSAVPGRCCVIRSGVPHRNPF